MSPIKRLVGKEFASYKAELQSYFTLLFATRYRIPTPKKTFEEIFKLCHIQTTPQPGKKLENVSGMIDEILYGK